MTIGKTRQLEVRGQIRGVLHRLPVGEFSHGRVAPPPDLADRVEHFWRVRWNLEGLPPQVQETLPHPNVHLVVEPGEAAFWGVHTGRWTRTLRGCSSAFGVKFRPGAFRPWLGRPVSALANASMPAVQLLADAAAGLAAIPGCERDEDAAELAAGLLRARMPPLDEAARLAGRIVDAAVADLEMRSAGQLAERFGLGLRTLQRLFNDYVGASPKWVINRYRMHEAIARAKAGEAVSWAALAQELGYFDQAHFIADFRRLAGCTPAEYARRHAAR